jgi:hypothetical protein
MRTVRLRSCQCKRHLGVDFAIWRNEGAWGWFLLNPRGKGAMVGASANETQAMREPCLSIEEKLNSHPSREPEIPNQLKTTAGLAHAIQ